MSVHRGPLARFHALDDVPQCGRVPVYLPINKLVILVFLVPSVSAMSVACETPASVGKVCMGLL